MLESISKEYNYSFDANSYCFGLSLPYMEGGVARLALSERDEN
jgi:hypothetical protein